MPDTELPTPDPVLEEPDLSPALVPPPRGKRPCDRPLTSELRVGPLFMLTQHRQQHAPLVECHGCLHLGPPVSVREPSGARRLRRVCTKPGAPRLTTQPDWPACPLKETR
jgi:hypothetical protein